jgi:hypothetical protein
MILCASAETTIALNVAINHLILWCEDSTVGTRRSKANSFRSGSGTASNVANARVVVEPASR